LVTGGIAVGASIQAAGEDKLAAHGRALAGAVLEKQPAAPLEVPRCIARDLAQAAERVRTRCQGEPWLVSEILERRVIRRDVRRGAYDQIEARARGRRKPAALAEGDAGKLQFRRLGARDRQGLTPYGGGREPPRLAR